MSLKNAINKYGKKFVKRYTDLPNLEDPVDNLVDSVELSEFISNWTEEQKDNKDLVRIIFLNTYQGWQLKYVSDRLKNDKDVVIEAIQSDVAAIPHIGESLNDDDEVIQLITDPNLYLHQVSGFISNPEGFGDPYEMAIKYAPKELLASKEFRDLVFRFANGYSKFVGEDNDMAMNEPINERILSEIFAFYDQGEDVLQYKQLIVKNMEQQDKMFCVFKKDTEGNRYGQFLDGSKIQLHTMSKEGI